MKPTKRQKTLANIALAVGFPLCSEWAGFTPGIGVGLGQGDLRHWNPYDDSSQAFELMTLLEISIQQDYLRQQLRLDARRRAGVRLHTHRPWQGATPRHRQRSRRCAGEAMNDAATLLVSFFVAISSAFALGFLIGCGSKRK